MINVSRFPGAHTVVFLSCGELHDRRPEDIQLCEIEFHRAADGREYAKVDGEPCFPEKRGDQQVFADVRALVAPILEATSAN